MNIAIIIAGGSGQRMVQDIPKQFLNVNDKPILIYTLEIFQCHENIDAIVVVTLSGWKNMIEAYARQFGISKLTAVIEGGSTRFESVRNGINHLAGKAAEEDLLLFHDGNRPLVSEKIISDGIEVARRHGCALSAAPCNDSMYLTGDSECVSGNIDRTTLMKGQSPEVISYGRSVKLYENADRKGLKDMTIAMLLTALGEKVYLSYGNEKNIKITLPEDIEIFKALLNTGKPEWMK